MIFYGILLPVRYLKNTIFFRFSSFYFRKTGKKYKSRGVFDRVGRVTGNTPFFFWASKMRNVFLHVSRAYKTRCISLKLFKRWSEPVAKLEAYHPCRQHVVIILSIFMVMRLLWLPFNDRYGKIMCIMG